VAPAPQLAELVAIVGSEAADPAPLAQLTAAAVLAQDLTEAADALVSHYVDRCRRDGRSWTEISLALGVTKQAVHKRFSTSVAPNLDRFTRRARTALDAAVDAARSLGHNYVGTEHLLLGLFEPAGGIAARVLSDTGIERGQVETATVAIVPRGASMPSAAELPFTPRSNRVLAGAVAAALDLGHNSVGTEHLLLAMFDDPGGLAAKILTQLGATRTGVRAAVVALLAGWPHDADRR
jgi:hypothetical protein